MLKPTLDNLVQTANAERELCFRSAACTRDALQGTRRSGDSWFVSDAADLLIVADGLDGRPEGASAAHIVCRSLVESLGERADGSPSALTGRLSDALWRANRELRRSGPPSGTQGLGSTVVLGVRYGRQFLIKSVGDSRAYLVRNGMATQLTADQTVDGVLAGLGSPRRLGVRNLKQQTLLSFLGQHDFVPNDEVRLVTSRAGDRLVFCTDTVTNGIDTTRIAGVFSGAVTPEEAAGKLVSLSGETQDDATCVVVFVEEEGADNVRG